MPIPWASPIHMGRIQKCRWPRSVQAVALADIVTEHFRDPREGGFFYTANDHESLIARNKDIYDNATPSSSAMAATGLLRHSRQSRRTRNGRCARRFASALRAEPSYRLPGNRRSGRIA